MRILATLVVSMLCTVGSLLAQSTQTVVINQSGNVAVQAKAGETVTVNATLFGNATLGDAAGDSLVLQLPGNSLTIAEHFITHSTTFVAPADNPVVTAAIVGGAQSAQLVFSTAGRFLQGEDDNFTLLARVYSRRGLAGETIGHLCTDPHCGVTGDVIATGAMAEAKRYSDLQANADDFRFSHVSAATVVSLPLVQAGSSITQDQADAFNGWANNEAHQIAFLTAMRTAINRANTAAATGHRRLEQRQLDAAGQGSIELASLLNTESGLRSTLLSAFQSGGFQPITFLGSQVAETAGSIDQDGLPQTVVTALSDEHFSGGDINFIAGELFSKDPTPFTPFLYPNIIVSPAVDAAQAVAVQNFVNIALRFGQPLKNDMRVSAEGSVRGADGRTSFAANARLDASGNPAGQFTLNFTPQTGTGLSIQSQTIQSVAILGSQFLVTGTFQAADGSNQTFFFSANRDNGSITIGTSQRFNATGSVDPDRIVIHGDGDDRGDAE